MHVWKGVSLVLFILQMDFSFSVCLRKGNLNLGVCVNRKTGRGCARGGT